MKDGVPVLGYFWWTLTDNYEWGSFDPRFGLYRVECQSGDFTRHPTPAVETYRRIIAANGVTTELFHEHFEGEWGRSA
jgi:beta-glucosidase